MCTRGVTGASGVSVHAAGAGLLASVQYVYRLHDPAPTWVMCSAPGAVLRTESEGVYLTFPAGTLPPEATIVIFEHLAPDFGSLAAPHSAAPQPEQAAPDGSATLRLVPADGVRLIEVWHGTLIHTT